MPAGRYSQSLYLLTCSWRDERLAGLIDKHTYQRKQLQPAAVLENRVPVQPVDILQRLVRTHSSAKRSRHGACRRGHVALKPSEQHLGQHAVGQWLGEELHKAHAAGEWF